MKRTKIVSTIGPASSGNSELRAMSRAGMNVARLAFSHGSYESHLILLQTIRDVSRGLDMPIAVMQDLQGPRIRIGKLPNEGIQVMRNEKVVLVSESYFQKHQKRSQVKLIPIQFSDLYLSVKKKSHILVSDGLIDLVVFDIKDKNIYCSVKKHGVIHNHKGINLPGISIGGSIMTQKDKKDLAFGVKYKVDFVALSFVKNAQDIRELRGILSRLEKRKNPRTKIIAKIERQEAVDHFDEIV
ncbi:MAG TPA: pyruvate kinase, partial [Patescibacteria group bacterium]|nr:pyruvate kinase [Patescibacteria group bacterium]